MKTDFRYQRGRGDGSIAADESGRVQSGSGKMAGYDPGKHQPPYGTVRTEFAETIGGIFGSHIGCLPAQLHGCGDQPSPEHRAEAGSVSRCPPEKQGGPVEREEPGPRMRP